ncbi:MAG: hypothetical protein M0006_06365 [Magnetospirillum sp.]|nr:hypothetical protein [Magnetospirillum sp.]
MGKRTITRTILLAAGGLLCALAIAPAMAQPGVYPDEIGTNGIPSPPTDGVPSFPAAPGGLVYGATPQTFGQNSSMILNQSSMGFGSPNSVVLNQSGSGNHADSQQLGGSNMLYQQQTGNNNTLSAQQLGSGNSLVEQQIGSGAGLSVTQFGGASAIVTQRR